MKTRIRQLLAVAFTSAALGGVLAPPASAAAPQFVVEVHCLSLGSQVTIVVVGNAGVQQVIGQLAQACDRGTMRVSVETL